MEKILAKRDSNRRATLAYKARQEATNPVEFAERQRGYARKCFRKYYATNTEYRVRHLQEAKDKYYYDNSTDRFLLCVRLLFQ